MFLRVPAYTGCPGSKDVKRSLLLLVCLITGSRSTLKKKQFEISMNDRVSVFIELADAYRQLGQQVWTSGLLPPHR